MKVVIPPDVIEQTKQCQKGFACLSQSTQHLCKIEPWKMGKDLIIQCRSTKPCHYQHHFGGGYLCTCPMRKTIYARYKI